MYSFKINNKKSLAIGIVFVCIFIALTVRLYVLMIHPTSTVQGELKNHQVEYSSDNNYKIFDTNGENLINYKNKYIMVLDTKPFKLNNYEETLQDLLALNFIMKSEDKAFNFSDIMRESGKIYYKITKESYDKINKLNDIKGIYTYVYNEVDLKERWRVENIIASIDKDNVIKGSFESKIEDIISENKRPTIGFYLDDKSVYKSNETNSGENNKNIRLTIDKSITEKIRNVLKSDEFNNLDNVGVVLLESKSGKIRAMVQKDESEANINLGIGQLGFEPGSIFKILTEADIKELQHRLDVANTGYDILNTTNIVNYLMSDLLKNTTLEKGLTFSQEGLNFINELKAFNYKKIYSNDKNRLADQYFNLVSRGHSC